MQQTKPARAATLNIDLQEKFIAQRSTHDLMEYSVICHYNFNYMYNIYIYIYIYNMNQSVSYKLCKMCIESK